MAAGIVLGVAALYVFSLLLADPGLRGPASLAYGFQLACWACSLVLLIYANPYRRLRISDPGLLFILWTGLYLILPSIFWLKGATIPWSEHITSELAVELFWLHGIFIFSLIGCYLLARPPKSRPIAVDVDFLPSGWALFLIPIVPLFAEVLLRVASGGGVLPERTYGEGWEALHETIQVARGAGGLSYVWVQIQSKTIYYPVLIQGVGLGMIISHSFGRRRYPLHTLVFVAIVILAMLIFGSGARSGIIMVILVGLILTDILAGPIPLRYLFVALVAGLAVFDFLGLYRAYRGLPFDVALSDALEAYRSADMPVLGEFTGMLSKEALVLQYVRDSGGGEGLNYLLQQSLAVFPSQLVPWKLSWVPTGDLTSQELLGRSFFLGAGAAGTMLGDCFRFAGTLGVPLLAGLMGAVTAWTQRWLMGRSVITGKTNLLRLGIWSGFLGWAFMNIRNDPGSMLVLLLYGCLIPWFILTVLLSKGTVWMKTWIAPLARLPR